MLEISGKLECKDLVDPDYNNPFEIDIVHTSLENMCLMYILFLLVRTMTVSILHFKFHVDIIFKSPQISRDWCAGAG